MPINFGSQEFLDGDMAQSNCVLQKGDKPLAISWLFNEQPLLNTDEIQILRVGRSSILTIDPVSGHHQGNYTCVASNPAGRMATSTKLIVNGISMYPSKIGNLDSTLDR